MPRPRLLSFPSPLPLLRGAFWLLAGMALTGLFWGELWEGRGLIGGDIYSYFLPQKAFYAERLADGEMPLWNNLAGHGYPLLGESQTGALYPPNLLAYPLASLNTAYNSVQLLHYVLAFGFTVLYARRIGLSAAASGLAAIVYTYAWFPARITLEWAIVCGAWLPLALWCVEGYLSTGRRRDAAFLAVVLAVQMLPGHFNLAFITQLTILAYAAGRSWRAPRPRTAAARQEGRRTGSEQGSGRAGEGGARHGPGPGPRWGVRGFVPLAAAVPFAFALAAVQLLPTWELKRLSQRAEVGAHHEPGELHIPPWYWSQIVAPWAWYGQGFDLNSALPPGAPKTNRTEAHLYFGLVPLALLVYGLAMHIRERRARPLAALHPSRGAGPSPPVDGVLLLWVVLGLAAFVYTSGWLIPVTRHLPGFSFFLGPARFGIVTTLAAAVLAAAGLDRLMARQRRPARVVLAALVLAVTTADLWLVAGSYRDQDFWIVENPPVNRLAESEVRRALEESAGPVRLFSPGANLPTLLGVASTPPYLGFGPDAYFDPERTMPQPLPFAAPPTPEQLDWLRRAGVTHVVSFEPLEMEAWPVEPVWSGYDSFLCRAWARREPLFLYRLTSTRGRAALEQARTPAPHEPANAPSAGEAGAPAAGEAVSEDSLLFLEYRANRVVVDVESETGGTLILTDLAWPGWHVDLEGRPAEPLTIEGMYRGVALPPGRHVVTWTYRPWPARLGGGLSLLGVVVLTGWWLFPDRRRPAPP